MTQINFRKDSNHYIAWLCNGHKAKGLGVTAAMIRARRKDRLHMAESIVRGVYGSAESARQ